MSDSSQISTGAPAYKRILLKLSGEALMGDGSYGINRATISRIVEEIKEVVGLGVQVAVVIGGGSLSGGEGSIMGTMIGVFIMSFLRNGCTMMGWPNYIQEIIIGIIIVVAVALDQVRHRRDV